MVQQDERIDGFSMTVQELARAAGAEIRQLLRTNPDATTDDLAAVIEQHLQNALGAPGTGSRVPLPPRICGNCTKVFTPVLITNTRFCSTFCSSAWHGRESRRRAAERNGYGGKG